MRKIVVGAGVLGCALVGLLSLAGRGTYEIKGLARASADVASESVTEAIPEPVHDRKIEQELKQVRLDLVDRQVQMNLSSRKIEELAAEVTKLEASTERRQRLLRPKPATKPVAVRHHWVNERAQTTSREPSFVWSH